MHAFRFIYGIFLDALFPLSPTERELFSYSPEKALAALPRALPPPPARTHAVFAYGDERVSRLVWNIKYKKSARAVAIGAYALYHSLPPSCIIIPLPITSRRRKERGFNQCELLAEGIWRLDAETGNAAGRISIRTDILARGRHQSRQTLKSRADRLKSAKGIFSVNTDVADFKILCAAPAIVLDDVITTGTTMKEAIDTLVRAGFRNVRGLSLAH